MQLEIPYNVVRYVTEICYEKGVKVIFNPAPATSKIDEEIIKKSYILIPNETELFLLAGEDNHSMENIDDVVQKVYKKGVKNLIVTLGSKGSVYFNGERKVYVKSKKVKAVDSTAAGDSFIGALAIKLAEGQSIVEAIEFANLAAALTVTKPGAQVSLPTREEVGEFMSIDN